MWTLNSHGQRLFFSTLGRGEPVILLAGSRQSHVAFLDSGLADALAQHFTVYLMDPTGRTVRSRGSGLTSTT